MSDFWAEQPPFARTKLPLVSTPFVPEPQQKLVVNVLCFVCSRTLASTVVDRRAGHRLYDLGADHICRDCDAEAWAARQRGAQKDEEWGVP